MVHDDDDDDSGVVGGGGARAGGGSDTTYSGGGSDTTAGSGVTGDDGSDSTYGGGGDTSTSAPTGSTGSDDPSDDDGSDFGGGSDDDDSDFGGGDDDDNDVTDRNTTYSGGGSSTTAGSGSTGDSTTDTTYSGGGGDQTTTQTGSGVTGDDSGGANTETSDGQLPGDLDSNRLAAADRGYSVTREGDTIDGGQLERSERAQEDVVAELTDEFRNSGLEDDVSEEDGPAADRVQQLQRRIDQEVEGVSRSDTDLYNIVRTERGGLEAVFAPGAGSGYPTPTEQRQDVASEIASGREGVDAEDVVVTQTAEGYEATTRDGSDGIEMAVTGEPKPERSVPEVRVSESVNRGFGITRGPDGTTVVTPQGGRQPTGTPVDRSDFSSFTQAQRDGTRSAATGPVTRAEVRGDPNAGEERFGDIDWSFGLGGPEDEVEQFTDERLPAAVANRTEGLDRRVAAARDVATGTTERPVGVPGTGIVGQSSPAILGADLAEDILTFVDDSARVPGQVLEGAETLGYASGQVDSENDSGSAPSAADSPSALYVDPERSAAIASAGSQVASRAATYAVENPQDVATQALAGAVLSAGAGRALGYAGRAGIDRVRTAGATRVDLEDVTNEETAAYYRGENADPDARFPGADDPDLYQTDPAEAVRRQADENTPEEIQSDFDQAGVTEGTDLKKGLETEPEGPEQPRIGDGSGFQTQEGSYESPGAFAGPELSPNFLGVGERSYSLRPGFPGMGGRPTGVIARTDVENPDADTMGAFNRELVDERAGDTTAVTKPADEVTTGEIEAVIPPGASFRAIDDGTSGGNRFGVGANYYTEVQGRRVPLRLVAPDDRVDAPDTTNVGETPEASGESLEYYVRSGDAGTDRPLATPADASTSSTASSESTTETTDVTDDGSRSATDAEDDLVRAQPRDSARDDDLLGVRPRERESADTGRTDGSAEQPDDGLTSVRLRDRDAESGRRTGSADRSDDDLLGVRPRDSKSSDSRRSGPESDDLLGVRPRDRSATRSDRSERVAGSTGGSVGSSGRSDRGDSYIGPSITSGQSSRGGESTIGSWLSTSDIPGRSTIGDEPGDTPLIPNPGPYPDPDRTPDPQPEPRPDPDRNPWDWNADMGADFDRAPERTSEEDRPLSVGYFNEFVADFALGPGPTRAPSQETLASFEGAPAFTEQLPTLRELEAEGESRDALEEAYDTFGFSGFGITTDDGGGGGLL